MIPKFLMYLLDGASLTTFIGGIISGHDAIILLGGLASVCAILNHGYGFLTKVKKNKKNKS